MRCWHPRASKVIKEVKLFNPEEAILLPLYPQFSASTSASSIKEWEDICKINNYEIKTSTICCYPTDNNFIKAHVLEINKKIKGIDKFKLIFSAHGLQEKNIKKGDPYQWQVEQTVNEIVKLLNYQDTVKIIEVDSSYFSKDYFAKRPKSEKLINKKLNLRKLNYMRNWKVCLNEYIKDNFSEFIKK